MLLQYKPLIKKIKWQSNSRIYNAQTKIIALAVAGLSTAAIAQTNVTIYGVADISGQGFNTSGGTQQTLTGATSQGGKFALQTNSSLIGFKGTEDLGNGLKALFQFENQINLTGTAGNTNTAGTTSSMFGSMRDSYAGLSNKYGTVAAGYLSTPFRLAVAGLDVMPGATGSMANNGLFGRTNMPVSQAINANAYGTASYNAAFRSTAIAYMLPTLYGFNGAIAYTGQGSNDLVKCNGVANCNGNQGAQNGLSLSLGWSGYGVGVIGAFQQVHANLGVPTGTANQTSAWTNYMLGAQYTGVPGLKVAAAYGRATVGENANTGTGAGAAKGSQNQVWAGVSYRFGNNEPRAMYANNSNISGLSQNNTAGTPQFGSQNGASQWGLGWGYYLSKRTQVYGLVSQIANRANGYYDFFQATTTSATNGGQRLTTYGVGMRTNF